jgi:CheY-like chemotaxis protein
MSAGVDAAHMPWKVLIVDDDVTVGMSLGFSDADVELTDVGRMAEARLAVAAEQFHVAIIDRRLPDGDGLELVRYLRSDPATAEMPIIVLTAGHDEADRLEVMAAGATDYLAKPIEPDALVRAFERAWGMEEAPAEPESPRRRPGLFNRAAVPEAKPTPELPALAVIEIPLSAEAMLRRECDAANARAAHAMIETSDLKSHLATAHEELTRVRAALAEAEATIATLSQRVPPPEAIRGPAITPRRRPLRAPGRP